MIEIIDTHVWLPLGYNGFTPVGYLKNVLSATRVEEINGENTLDFKTKLDGKLYDYSAEYTYSELYDLIMNDCLFGVTLGYAAYFDVAKYTMDLNSDGTYTISVETEHVSYRLNKPVYDVETFVMTDTPYNILVAILNGTSLNAGYVELVDGEGNFIQNEPVTYLTTEAKSRRQLLIEFVTSIGAELVFSGFDISIVTRKGSADTKHLINDHTLKVVSKIVDKRELDIVGNPTVYFSCKTNLSIFDYNLGDDILFVQRDLHIGSTLRILRISYDPHNMTDVEFEFTNSVRSLSSYLYDEATKSKVIAAGGLSDADLCREIHTMCSTQKVDPTFRNTVSEFAFIDGFPDAGGTDTNEVYDALDIPNMRLTCPVAPSNPDMFKHGGITPTMFSSTAFWIGQEFDADISARTLNSLSFRMPYDGGLAGTYKLYLYEQPNGTGTKPTSVTPVASHIIQDFYEDQIANGWDHCIQWNELAWNLEAGKRYVVWLHSSISMSQNLNHWSQDGDFTETEDGWYDVSHNEDFDVTLHGNSYSPNTFVVEAGFSSAAPHSTTYWTSLTQHLNAGSIRRLIADWFVSLAPESGATITVEVKYGTGVWEALPKGINTYVAGAPEAVQFRFILDNISAETEIHIDDFGAIWEKGLVEENPM